ncbi:hypothetical protein [Runella aurantiaca]|nr:hypothetical protein [Runella aurantiaca]
MSMLLFCTPLISQNKLIDKGDSAKNKVVKHKIKEQNRAAVDESNSKLLPLNQQNGGGGDLNDLVKAVWSGIAALILLPLSYLTKRYFDKFYEKKRIIDELRDIYRHFDRNSEVITKIIQTIETVNGKLSPIHIQKLKVIETSTLLFQTDTLRNIDSRYVHFLSRLKIGLRNANIEADGVIAFLEGESYNVATMKEYLTLLQNRSIDHQVQIKEILDTLGGEIPAKEARIRELSIIYHPLISG